MTNARGQISRGTDVCTKYGREYEDRALFLLLAHLFRSPLAFHARTGRKIRDFTDMPDLKIVVDDNQGKGDTFKIISGAEHRN